MNQEQTIASLRAALPNLSEAERKWAQDFLDRAAGKRMVTSREWAHAAELTAKPAQ